MYTYIVCTRSLHYHFPLVHRTGSVIACSNVCCYTVCTLLCRVHMSAIGHAVPRPMIICPLKMLLFVFYCFASDYSGHKNNNYPGLKRILYGRTVIRPNLVIVVGTYSLFSLLITPGWQHSMK